MADRSGLIPRLQARALELERLDLASLSALLREAATEIELLRKILREEHNNG